MTTIQVPTSGPVSPASFAGDINTALQILAGALGFAPSAGDLVVANWQMRKQVIADGFWIPVSNAINPDPTSADWIAFNACLFFSTAMPVAATVFSACGYTTTSQKTAFMTRALAQTL